MFNGIHIRKDVKDWIEKLNPRVMLLILMVIILSTVLIQRLFDLQIVNGENYQSSFKLRIRREVTVPPTRGNIYDRNGNVLAYNELSYSVTIRDQFENVSGKNEMLNDIIDQTITIIERGGDEVSGDFSITLSRSGNYEYTVQGQTLLRFLADIYGQAETTALSYAERTGTAADAMHYLCTRYEVDEAKYDKRRALQIVTVRYQLSLNNYQKYIPTTIAQNISERTASILLENAKILQGVDIQDDTVRRYADSKYFSHILGYTGKVSQTELEELKSQGLDYSGTDIVGKSGIEKSMEARLQGQKGKRTVFVDNLGRIIETTSQIDPVSGDDVYLTIDRDLQIAAYDILEKKLAEILISRIRPIKEYVPDATPSASEVVTPIYDVYYAPINNNLIDIKHFDAADASAAEKEAGAAFSTYMEEVLQGLDQQLHSEGTPYAELPKEYRYYESYYVNLLYNDGVLMREVIDTEDEYYQNWHKNETISISTFLQHAIAQGWVDVTRLNTENKYSDTAQLFEALCDYTESRLREDQDFARLVYKYVIQADRITGRQICQILMDQGLINVPAAERAAFDAGTRDAYDFMIERIRQLDLTPAQLALDPFSGSMVITDVNNGDVLALVSYPSYDNNRMSNGVDAEYFSRLRHDLSSPLLNYATQQSTAPGSTFKPVSATAGLMEGVIDLSTIIQCTGVYHKDSAQPRCWVYPGGHGELSVSGGIRNSCNVFFYDVGWRLSQVDENYQSDAGLEKLAKYASMYGLDAMSGIEIEEAPPQVSSEDAIRSAIGQGNSNYTTVGLARYVTTLANSGTCYDLTLIDHLADPSGSFTQNQDPKIHGMIRMEQAYWDAIHEGMRGVVEDMSFFADMPIEVAGKTGTAQQDVNRPNHALFICYAPYRNPQIAVATRVANGYTSSYAAQITQEVLKYYFDVADKEQLMHTDSIVETTVGD